MQITSSKFDPNEFNNPSRTKFSFNDVSEVEIKPLDFDSEEMRETAIKSRKKCRIIVVALIVSVLIGVGIGLALWLTKPADKVVIPQKDPCSQYDCSKVPDKIKKFIFGSYSESNQIKTLLKISSTLTNLNSNTPLQHKDRILTYRQLFTSAQCLSISIPDSYQNAYQSIITLQFQEADIYSQRYIEMTGSFSGQPLQLLNDQQLQQVCGFSTGTRRVLLNSSSYCEQSREILIVLTGIGSGPSNMVRILEKVEKIARSNNSSFTGKVLGLGTLFYNISDVLGIGLYNSIVKGYQQQQRLQNKTILGKNDLFKYIQFLSQMNNQKQNIPSNIQQTEFISFSSYFYSRILDGSIVMPLFYDTQKHTYLFQKFIVEGKRIFLLVYGQAFQYSNFILHMLVQDKAFVGVMAIAPLYSFNQHNPNYYITFLNDNITGGRVNCTDCYFHSFEPNIGGGVFNDLYNHGLLGYLQSYSSQIIGQIFQLTSQIPFPDLSNHINMFSEGLITADLFYYPQSYTYLYVTEPDGSQLNVVNNTIGRNGIINIYDLANNGAPQHYNSNCTIMAGKYVFNIKWTILSASQAITIIKAGYNYFMKQIYVDPVNHPQVQTYYVCTLLVEKKEQGYKFTIYE